MLTPYDNPHIDLFGYLCKMIVRLALAVLAIFALVEYVGSIKGTPIPNYCDTPGPKCDPQFNHPGNTRPYWQQ